jgi:hypothetical protein
LPAAGSLLEITATAARRGQEARVGVKLPDRKIKGYSHFHE